jgi:hypothetical protein
MIAKIQKLVLFTVALLLPVNLSADTDPPKKYIPQEVIVFVTLKINENKSMDEIKAFTKKYSEFVDKTEPDSLGWGYHQSGDKVILIERYKNEDANILTIENISPGGIRHQLMNDQLEIFTIEKISVYGAFTQKLIDYHAETAKKLNFQFPIEHHPMISGYSKNAK